MKDKPSGKTYDTATQSFRKGTKPAEAGAKSGFAKASSTTRPLSQEEHEAAAGCLTQGGLHRAAAHHRSASDQMEHESENAGKGDSSQDNGMFGNNVPGTQTGVPPAMPGMSKPPQPGVRNQGALAGASGRKKGKPSGASVGPKPFGK